jgi:aspartate-semialdehyde dehydrogenase
MGYKVAVIGATGNVGRDAQHPLRARIPRRRGLPSPRRSMGVEVSFGDHRKCRDLEQFDFSGVDFALMSAGSAVSKGGRPKSARKAAW